MTSKEVTLTFVDAINRRDVETLFRLMTGDHLLVDTDGARCRGRETTRSGWRAHFSVVHDYTIEVDEVVAGIRP